MPRVELPPRTKVTRLPFSREVLVNLPFDKVVEIHIDLVDELSRKLKLEGLSPEYLCDYRLTLIDVLAHLGEMYRRSLPMSK